METQILTDPEVEPTAQALEDALGTLFPVYREFMDTLESEAFGLSPQWRYYKDGKAWLCKISRKKKTVVWMSAWAGFLRLGFYFTEKTGAGIPELDIDPALKDNYATGKPVGKLKPLIIDIADRSSLDDAYAVVAYKAGLT